MQSEVALPAGFALNEYRIEATLGVGGFGLTYLAVDSNLDLKVAIKEYLPNDIALRNTDNSVSVKSESATESFAWGRARFLDESRTLASFRHANIVRVMRFFEANHTAYMVMEFVAGKPLNDWIVPRRPPPQTAILSMLLPLLDGLEVVHKAGYLHRDIKPANIFMRDDGTPVLIDFGSARSNRGSDLTAIVTPGYAPLEQYHAQGNQGPWSDLYSLGAVLYWMVTGQKPVESAARARNDPLVPAAEAGDGRRYSHALLKAIDWALNPAEEMRPQSVARFRDALMQVEPPKGSQEPTVLANTLPASGTPGQPHSISSTVFDRSLLEFIGAELATHIGPIARTVVRAASKKALTVSHLIELTSAEIEEDRARMAYVKMVNAADRAIAGTAQTSPAPHTQLVSHPPSQPFSQPVSQSPTGLSRFNPQLLMQLEAELSKHIGAVARIVVKRAAARARDETELFLIASDEIEDPVQRKAFTRLALWDTTALVIPSLLVAAQFGLIAVILAFGAAPLHSLPAAVMGAGGVLLGLWTLLHNRPGNFNIRPLPKSGGLLVTDGPYRWIRHPMYTAVLLVMASFTFAAYGLHPGWVALVALFAVLTAKARLEERLLRIMFSAYAEYADRTHRFVPGMY